MSLSIGIVGLPNVGKSTLFEALTQKQVDTSNYPFATIDPNVGVVTLPDERLEKLAAFSASEKVVPAITEFVDIAGLVKDAAKGEGLGNKFLANIREVDAICHVVRAFKNENITHVSGVPHPKEDLEVIKTELLLKDLEVITKATEKAGKEAKTGRKEAMELFNNLSRLKKALEEGDIGALEGDEVVEQIAKDYQLLSFKPYLIAYNVSELSENIKVEEAEHTIIIDAQQEKELAGLSIADQKELGTSSQIPKLIKKALSLLGLITFFTTGETESRAWTIPSGATAKRAGRAIHSDFEEKFIRADLIAWDKLLEAGSWAGAKEKGWMGTVGKEHMVEDGDVMEFRI